MNIFSVVVFNFGGAIIAIRICGISHGLRILPLEEKVSNEYEEAVEGGYLNLEILKE